VRIASPNQIVPARAGFGKIHRHKRKDIQNAGHQTIPRLPGVTSRGESNPAYGDARICAFLGENEKALQYLEQAYRGKAFLMAFVRADPIFDGMKTEPRYQAVVKKMGL